MSNKEGNGLSWDDIRYKIAHNDNITFSEKTGFIQINKLVEKLDIKYKTFEPKLEQENIMGLYNSSEKVIAINNTLTDEESLFSTAHELGHAILHNESKQEYIRFKNTNQDKNQEETEANMFAYEVLLPIGLFQKECNKLLYSVSDLSKFFSLSEYRIVERIKFLRKKGFLNA